MNSTENSNLWRTAVAIAMVLGMTCCNSVSLGSHSSGLGQDSAEVAVERGSQDMENTGIPDGWDAYEQSDLRSGAWRFYRIVDRDRRSSVREDNLVLKGGQAISGVEGLAAFIKEHGLRENPQVIPSARLAAQVAMFVIRGSSRQSCTIRVVENPANVAQRYEKHRARLHPPETHLKGDKLLHRAWLERDGYLQHMVVSVEPDETVQAEFSEWLSAD